VRITSRDDVSRPLPDLRALFGEPILEQVELDPGFDDHGSSVFRVRTESEHVIVRSFRASQANGSFWRSLHTLFGIDPLDAREAVRAYELLAQISPIPVPGLRRTAIASGRTWLVVELMQGTPLASFGDLSDDGLHALGRGLATIHSRRFHTLGSPSGSLRYPPADFPRRLAELFRESVASGGVDGMRASMAEEMYAAAGDLAPPTEGVLVLPDIFPPQFLAYDGRVAAMIDLDAYVIGPRELDLVCLEYFVDERAAEQVARGYREIASMPSLRHVRRAYRYLFWVLEMNPMALDIDRWLSWPAAFD
jgi:hypothetical protein